MKLQVVQIYLLTSALILLLSTNLHGQSVNSGLVGGINSASVYGPNAKELDPHSINAFNAGLFIRLGVLDIFAVEPELLYTVKGYKVTYKSIATISMVPLPNFTVTGSISYLEIPVLLKLDIPSSSFGILRPIVFAGPAVAFSLSHKVNILPAGWQGQLLDPNINSTDFGIIFGLGADIQLPITTITIDARYDLGMKPLFPLETSRDIRNSVFTLEAGVTI